MLGNFDYEIHRPDDEEMKIMRFVERRRKQMDTNYRRELIETAEWSKKEYDAVPMERINNLDMFKTGLSRAVINHRLTMLYDNPSTASYKAVEDSDQPKVEILKQLDAHDKEVSRFAAIYQQLERAANIEGTAIGHIKWYEKTDGLVTVGEPCVLCEILPFKDFYWDEAGIFLNGSGAYICNDAAYGRIYSMNQFRDEFDTPDYKNVQAVMPNIHQPSLEVWNDIWMENWEKAVFTSGGDYVYVFIYKCKRFWENGHFVDKEYVIANGQVIYSGEMREPVISGEKWLPFFKVEGIPTGGFGGLGIPGIIRHPQDALDRMVTMAEAQAELAVNPVLFYQTAGELLPANIDYYPGAAYPYKGTGNGITNDLQFFQQPDITKGAQYIIDKMVDFITITTGVDLRALLNQPNQKAMQVENKQEVQQKILKMSVLWNEVHGFSDMAILRLAYMQNYYPVLRIKRILGYDGKEFEQIDYPRIKLHNFVAQKAPSGGKMVTSLVPKEGAFSYMSVKPEDVRFNVDVTIESSQNSSGVDIVRQNKWDKLLDSLSRIPNAGTSMGKQVMRNTVKFSGFKYSDVFDDSTQENDLNVHPARKEFKAILLSDVLEFMPITPEEYIPEDYIFIFKHMMNMPEYKKASITVKQLANSRLQYHLQNFVDPYFKERIAAQEEAQMAQQEQQNQMTGNVLKPLGGSNSTPTTLSGATRSQAASIGKITQNMSGEQMQNQIQQKQNQINNQPQTQ